MFSKPSKFILAVAFYILASASSFKIQEFDSKLDQNQALTRLFNEIISAKFDDITPAAGVDSQACFDEYKKKEAEINDYYNTDYLNCVRESEDSKAAVTKELENVRVSLVARGEEVCGGLSKCDLLNDGLEFLSCYHSASEESYSELFGMSIESTTQERSIKFKYSKIENTENECKSTALVDFYIKLHEALNEQQACLKGESTTTTTPEPSTETPEPSTETPEPSTETPEPSTETPEPSTETPEPSTETPEPSTETPEPSTETPEPSTETPEPSTETPEPSTETPGPSTETPEPSTETPEPSTETPEPSTETPEPSTETPEPSTETQEPETEPSTTTEEALPEEDLGLENRYNKFSFFKNLRRL